MPTLHCVAVGCTSDSRKWKNPAKYPGMIGVEFHQFPKENPERRIWYKLLRRGGDADHLTFERISYYHRVCSLHFVDGKPTTKNPHPTLFAYNSFKQPSTPRVESRRSQAVQGQLTTPKRSTTHQPRRLRVELPMGCSQLEAINCQPSIKLTKVDSHKGHLGSEVEIGPSNETGSGSLSDQGIMLDLYLCISHFIGYTGLAQDCGIFSAMKKRYLLHCLVPSHQHINLIITRNLGLEWNLVCSCYYFCCYITIIIDLMHFFFFFCAHQQQWFLKQDIIIDTCLWARLREEC